MSTNAGGKADDHDSRLERDEPVAATKVSLGVGGLGRRLSARHLADDYLESEARLGPVKTLPGLGTSSCPSRSLPAGQRRRSRSLMAACGPTPWSTSRARTPPSSSARRAPPRTTAPSRPAADALPGLAHETFVVAWSAPDDAGGGASALDFVVDPSEARCRALFARDAAFTFATSRRCWRSRPTTRC